MDRAGGFVCLCAPGYTGDRCQKNVDDCASNPCLHGGICIDGVNTFSCHCALPYDGDRCQYKSAFSMFLIGSNPHRWNILSWSLKFNET